MSPERLILVGASALAAVLILWTVASWEPAMAWTPPVADPDNYRAGELPATPWLATESGDAGEPPAASPFAALSDRRELPPDDLEVPPVPPGPPPAPPFTPAPAYAIAGYEPFLLRSPLARKVPRPEDLPAAETLEPLAALARVEAPPAAPPKDAKGADFDAVLTKSEGLIEGTITEQNAREVRIRDKSGKVITVSRKDIQAINRARGMKTLYEERRAAAAANDAKAQTELAAWCVERGLREEALTAYEAAIAAGRADPRGYTGLADLARRECDLDAELTVLARAVAAKVSGIEAVLLRVAEVSRALGLVESAQKALEAATKAHPTLAEGRLRYGLALIDAGRLEAAAEQVGRGVELAGTDAAAAPLSAFAAGMLALARNDPRTAVPLLAKAVAGAPAPAPEAPTASPFASGVYPDDLAWPRLAHGSAAAHLESWSEAAASFVDAIRVAPDDPRGWTALGTLYLLADRLPDARVCYAEAVRRDPSAATPAAALAVVTFLEGKPDEALTQVTAALNADPEDGYARLVLGYLLLAREEAEKALPELAAALRAGGRYPPTLYLLGAAAMRRGSYGLAAGAFESVLAADTTRPELPAALGLALLGRGDFERAEPWLRQALRLAPEHAAALEGAAWLDYQARRPAEALARLEAVAAASGGADAYAARALTVIKESAGRTLWEDDFDRPDAEDLGKGWFESEKFGVEARVAGRAVRFSGTQAIEDGGEAAAERVVRTDAFARVEAELELADAGAATIGLRVAAKAAGGVGGRPAGLRFGRTGKGKLVVAVSVEGELAPKWRELGDAPAGPRLRLGIERTASGAESEYTLLVDGKAVGTQKATMLDAGTENLTCGVFGAAAKGERWAAGVVRFRLIERKRR
ncbi:MAG: tetratricopeptide repeat protein [Planctomycetes bacterium]|nr:tetratricopeptide repeat protein [Planctomycetota bacterium]